ncbi:6,7-dimethyl-8-ribityllumazine synthase [Marinomonas sp. 15G1-11]|uniref:6,7-dimethyl-8-ribityllumazine synthase n=1 Tax=Marinomonas phaeophyticola TaxID=3004091 RepID=A0ABT4JQR9_9GAMM|nr:6,7-dimethyl-8-ribityllumazine synthase [Marinomonas sp. 15G1-11]MCZ2720506.1 6,7-dimethyl-8-ribityllumazine synthase [Marinomonas sp. 15G1-11]
MNQSSTNLIDFTPATKRIAIFHATWHEDIVMNAVNGFKDELISRGYNEALIETISVPGAYEIPLQAKLLAKSGKYSAIAASALVVDGGIYRHDFVAQTVCNALMQVQLETEVPVLTAVLTPHNFHEHDEHKDYFRRHFLKKGTELANACDMAIQLTEKAKQL